MSERELQPPAAPAARGQNGPARTHAFTVTTLQRAGRTMFARSSVVPMIRMAGQWLESYGFTRGARVIVTAEEGKLVLTLAGAEAETLPN